MKQCVDGRRDGVGIDRTSGRRKARNEIVMEKVNENMTQKNCKGLNGRSSVWFDGTE